MNGDIVDVRTVAEDAARSVRFCLDNVERVPVGSDAMMEFLAAAAELHASIGIIFREGAGEAAPNSVAEGDASPDDPHAVLRVYLGAMEKNLLELGRRKLSGSGEQSLGILVTACAEMRGGVSMHVAAA